MIISAINALFIQSVNRLFSCFYCVLAVNLLTRSHPMHGFVCLIFGGMAAGQWIETFPSGAHRRSFVLTLAGYPAQRMLVFGDDCGGGSGSTVTESEPDFYRKSKHGFARRKTDKCYCAASA